MTHRILRLAVLAAAASLGCNDLGEKFGCVEDSDCASDRACTSGLCVAPCDAELCADLACNPLGGCQAGTDGELCVSREHCAETRRCGPNLECQLGASGDPCTVQDHCAAGRYCGVDGQCHLGATGDPCENDPQCLSGICGPLARCQEGAAGDPCQLADDCQESLSCGASGTCVGCTGVPTPCDSLDPPECSNTTGCSVRKTCTGAPPFCGFQDKQVDCEAVEGCAWNGTSCAGLPTRCEEYSSETPCVAQAGCFWDDACAGEALECSELIGTACIAQPGCRLD